jgi:hypothetical protein
LSRRVVASYGSTLALPRAEQLLRRVNHFDTGGETPRYILVQSGRNLRDLFETRIQRRSARERLNLAG